MFSYLLLRSWAVLGFSFFGFSAREPRTAFDAKLAHEAKFTVSHTWNTHLVTTETEGRGGGEAHGHLNIKIVPPSTISRHLSGKSYRVEVVEISATRSSQWSWRCSRAQCTKGALLRCQGIWLIYMCKKFPRRHGNHAAFHDLSQEQKSIYCDEITQGYFSLYLYLKAMCRNSVLP